MVTHHTHGFRQLNKLKCNHLCTILVWPAEVPELTHQVNSGFSYRRGQEHGTRGRRLGAAALTEASPCATTHTGKGIFRSFSIYYLLFHLIPKILTHTPRAWHPRSIPHNTDRARVKWCSPCCTNLEVQMQCQVPEGVWWNRSQTEGMPRKPTPGLHNKTWSFPHYTAKSMTSMEGTRNMSFSMFLW